MFQADPYGVLHDAQSNPVLATQLTAQVAQVEARLIAARIASAIGELYRGMSAPYPLRIFDAPRGQGLPG